MGSLDPDKNKQDLADEIKRDERDDAVENLFDEALEMYNDSAKGSIINVDHEALRNVLRLAYEEWCQ